MNDWQNFEQRHRDEIATQNFICPIDDIGLILVNGADAREFLQNQLSNDIDRIDESSHQLSAYSTPKGRMLGIFRVVQVSNGYLMLTPKSMLQPLLQQLFKYIVGADVGLADASDYFARFALQTDAAGRLADDALPAAPGGVLQTDSLISLGLEPLGAQRRFIVMSLSADEAIASWKRFADSARPAGFRSWRLSEIRAGIPTIYPQTSSEFVLQMANLAALDGVSFKKGCYPGQEIVARMQYLGKLKRRMYLAELDTETLPEPGDDLVAADHDEPDGSGKVVDAAFDPDGLCHCLYIARIDRADSGSLQLLKQAGVQIRNVELPYAL